MAESAGDSRQFGNGFRLDLRNSPINFRIAPRRWCSASTNRFRPSRSPSYHSSGISAAHRQMVSSIHLFGSAQRWFKCLPSHDTLVNAIVRVYTSERTVRETPLAGIEAVALVDEGCGVSLPSRRFPEDCLPSIAVARPLIQDKDPSEVAKIANTLQQLTEASSRMSLQDSRSPRTAIPIACRSGTESWSHQD